MRPAAGPLVDTHAHLTAIHFDEDRAEVLTRAREAGVRAIVTIGAGHGLAAMAAAVNLAESETDVWASVGVHPHDCAEWGRDAEARIRDLLQHPRVVAVGECGLDTVYRDPATAALEREAFEAQCRLAHDSGKPLIVHTRDDFETTHAILRDYGIGREVAGVVHFFTVDRAQAEAYLALGLMLGIPGVVTLPNAAELTEAVPHLPLDRLLIETDSPYAAPRPRRGRRNEPAFVGWVADRIAELQGRDPLEVARATAANAVRLFDLPATLLEGEQA